MSEHCEVSTSHLCALNDGPNNVWCSQTRFFILSLGLMPSSLMFNRSLLSILLSCNSSLFSMHYLFCVQYRKVFPNFIMTVLTENHLCSFYNMRKLKLHWVHFQKQKNYLAPECRRIEPAPSTDYRTVCSRQAHENSLCFGHNPCYTNDSHLQRKHKNWGAKAKSYNENVFY